MSGPTVLVQNPILVRPPETSVFLPGRPSYDPVRASAESAELRSVLTDLGACPSSPSEVLAGLEREILLELAARAVGADDAERAVSAREALAGWSAPALVPLVLRQPRLLDDASTGRQGTGRQGTGSDATGAIDQPAESCALQPLAGLMFPRDHYVDLGGAVAVGRLRDRNRARETVIMASVLRGLRGRSAEVRVPEPLFLAGGDLVSWGDTAVLGTGFRTSQAVWGLLRPYLLAAFGRVVRVRDEVHRPEQIHLDSWLALGPGIALVAADRLQAAAVVECDGVAGRETTLVDALRTIDLAVCPLPPEAAAAFATQVFFLPSDATAGIPVARTAAESVALTSTASVAWTEPVLTRCGVRTVAVAFDEHHRQLGSLHRAINTVPSA